MKIYRIATLISVLCTTALISTPTIALAAKPGSNGGGTTTSTPTGNDISWPQCSKLKSLPSGQAFGIVGVNDGLANTTNPCFSQELTWANKSSGATSQPKAALYVNTANPGDVIPAVADWPASNKDVVTGATDTDPYGTCTGSDDTACSWQYGYNMANQDVNRRGVANPATYRWYLDVETDNSWASDGTKNAADLEGMTAYFTGVGVHVGLYSTSTQWHTIVGTSYGSTVDAGGNILNGLIDWLPGASNLSGAEASCKLSPLTSNGQVDVAQYVSRQSDYDVSCV